MLSKKLEEAINAQVNRELWSAYLYLSMSLDAENKGFKGIANWFFVQFREEQDHAKILMNHLNTRGSKVVLKPIEAVQTTWESIHATFKDSLEQEKKVTAFIHELTQMAIDDHDFAALNMLNWFVDEQVEEEEQVTDILNTLDQLNGMHQGLYMLNKDLAARTYSIASPLAKEADE